MPQQLPSRLLDGMEQDARGQHYHSWEDLYGYCFNVAATVGLMMTCVMGHKLPASRHAEVLLRAADLGVAMQLTNIARDVGEDARRGRVYLPDELLGQHGLSSAAVLAEAAPSSHRARRCGRWWRTCLCGRMRTMRRQSRGLRCFQMGRSGRFDRQAGFISGSGGCCERRGWTRCGGGRGSVGFTSWGGWWWRILAGLLPGARRWSQTPTLGPADELIGRYCREVGVLD
jgi:hypothetical protein